MIHPDKLQHFVAGFMIYALAWTLMTPVSCIIICALFAFAKEFLDSYDGRRFNMADFLFTMGGGALALLIDLVFFQ
jgi:hypothetical protein